jgi:protein TonB
MGQSLVATLPALRENHLRRESRKRIFLSALSALALFVLAGTMANFAGLNAAIDQARNLDPIWLVLDRDSSGSTAIEPASTAAISPSLPARPKPPPAAMVSQENVSGNEAVPANEPAAEHVEAPRLPMEGPVETRELIPPPDFSVPRPTLPSDPPASQSLISGAQPEALAATAKPETRPTLAGAADRIHDESQAARASAIRGGAGPSVDPALALSTSLGAWIESNKIYPDAARRRGTKGLVRIALTVEADGRLASLRPVASSGSSLLDQAALELLRSAFPLLAGPGRKIDVVLAIRYDLKP